MRTSHCFPAAVLLAVLAATSAARAEAFRATQFRFAAAEGTNAVMLDWIRGPDDPIDLEVVEDGRVVARIKAFSGLNTFELEGLAAGPHTYEIRGVNGSLGSQAQTVLDARPDELGVPSDVECDAQNADGRCGIHVSWSPSDPAPAYYALFLDSEYLLSTADASQLSTTFPATTAGEHCVAVAAAISLQAGGASGFYRGETVASCCDVPCGADPCPPPGELSLAQVEFGPGAEDNAVLARWTSPSPYGLGTRILVNGSEVDLIDGAASSVVVARLAPARSYEIAVQGDCGPPSGVSSRLFDLFRVVGETAHTAPVAGEPTCAWTAEEGGRTTVNWTPQEPSRFVEVQVRRGNDQRFFARVADPGGSVTVGGTVSSDEILLQFFADAGGFIYGSRVFACRPSAGEAARFTRGVCTGAGDRPNLTAAIFALNYLFQGDAAPPCLEACNVNGDGAFNLSDAVFLLNYLFLGESPPPAWGGPDPVCEERRQEQDCAQGHAACAGA